MLTKIPGSRWVTEIIFKNIILYINIVHINHLNVLAGKRSTEYFSKCLTYNNCFKCIHLAMSSIRPYTEFSLNSFIYNQDVHFCSEKSKKGSNEPLVLSFTVIYAVMNHLSIRLEHHIACNSCNSIQF